MLDKVKIKEIRDIRTRLELELGNKNLPFQRKKEVESLRNRIDTWLEEKEDEEREHYREVIKSESQIIWGGINLMAMNSTQFKGVVVDRNKNDIIERYNRGVKINVIAGKYDVGVDTLCRRLRSWGIKVRKGDYHRKRTTRKHWYRKFSKEFIKNRAFLTKKYGNLIKYPKGVNRTSDQKLVRNILNKAFV